MVTCSICTIGDEFLVGQVVDTNSATIAKAMNQIGIRVVKIDSVGDNRTDILQAIHLLLKVSDILIVSGGLGPTKDDITKNVLADYTGSRSFYRASEQEKHIAKICKNQENLLFEINRNQADVPDTCTVMVNKLGTAPGMWFEAYNKVIISLPGVPFEMEGLLPQLLDRLKNRFAGCLSAIVHKTLSTSGIPESLLAKKISKWEDELSPDLHLAYLPNPISGVRLRLSCYGDLDGSSKIDLAFAQLTPILGEAIYGYEEESLHEVVAKLFIQKKVTLSSAESCTGGKVASLITSIPGSSHFYKGGVIAYHNKVKEDVLHIPDQLLEKYGAVSLECVEAMALGVQKMMITHYALATSGVAGPEGGSDEKPIGSVCIAVATPLGCTSKKFIFSGNRGTNIERFSATALHMLRQSVLLNT